MPEECGCNASIYNMEKLTASIRLEVDKFNNIWKGWLEYIKQHRTDFVRDVVRSECL